jgi:glycine/D-amino acid oxidase-like deaminating enzyme
VETYRSLDAEGAVATGLTARPMLLVASDERQLAHAHAYAEAVGGEPVEPDPHPWLAPGLAGAWSIDGCWSVDPMAATLAMAESATRAGAELWPGCEAKRLLLRRGRITGVATDAGVLACARVVVAAGPLTRPLLAAAGVHLPAAAVRGWLHELAPAPEPLPYAIEEALWPSQAEMGRIGSAPTLAEVASGPTADARVVSLLAGSRPGGGIVVGTSLNRSLREADEAHATAGAVAARACRIVPRLAELEVVATWSGRRTTSPDGRPIVGPIPGVDGLDVAGAFSSAGMVTIPGLCRGLAAGRVDPTCAPARLVQAVLVSG